MKNIQEILKEFGLEVPADKKADFDKAWKENYRTKSEYDNAVTQRDNYKTSLDDVNTRLKEFEGVDVKDLQGQITKLQGDLQAKDAEYAAKEADRQFHDSVKDAIRAAGGRNEKMVIRSAGWRSTSAAGCSSGQLTILILRIFMSISLSGWRSVPEKGTFQNWEVSKSHDTSGQRQTVI